MTAARKLQTAPPPRRDPVLEALANAPMGPADPPEIRAAIREGKDLGRFLPGSKITNEIERRKAWTKPGK